MADRDRQDRHLHPGTRACRAATRGYRRSRVGSLKRNHERCFDFTQHDTSLLGMTIGCSVTLLAEVQAVHSRNFIASCSDDLAATSLRSLRCKRCTDSIRRRSCADSRLLLLAELLEARIIPERIEHWVQPEQSRSERHVCGIKRAFVRC